MISETLNFYRIWLQQQHDTLPFNDQISGQECNHCCMTLNIDSSIELIFFLDILIVVCKDE